jgi:hypothetical protein
MKFGQIMPMEATPISVPYTKFGMIMPMEATPISVPYTYY